MLKIKVRYMSEKELRALLELLKPYIIKWKCPSVCGDAIKNAHIEIEIK